MWSRRQRRPRVRDRGELAPPPGLGTLEWVGIGRHGPIAVWSAPDGSHGPGSASAGTARDPTVALAEYVDSTAPTTVVTLPGLPVAYPVVDRLSATELLVVGARCQWSVQGPEQNAVVVSLDGTIVRRGCIGDGLEHVQVADDGTIWAGYFDEGVYGNLGWGGPGPEPLGHAGLVAWSPSFEKRWEYRDREHVIDDCYALNVAGDTVWACPYSPFAVVRVVRGETEVYPTENVAGPRGIIASGDRVGLLGTYQDPAVLVVGSLSSGRWVEERRTHLRAAEGGALPEGQISCRGSVAHLFAGARWHSFDLDDLD